MTLFKGGTHMRVVAKLMDNGRRIGFVLDNGERLLDYNILIKMKKRYKIYKCS